jgi:hypothetical protein
MRPKGRGQLSSNILKLLSLLVSKNGMEMRNTLVYMARPIYIQLLARGAKEPTLYVLAPKVDW